jgi:hypothetical protein
VGWLRKRTSWISTDSASSKSVSRPYQSSCIYQRKINLDMQGNWYIGITNPYLARFTINCLLFLLYCYPIHRLNYLFPISFFLIHARKDDIGEKEITSFVVSVCLIHAKKVDGMLD